MFSLAAFISIFWWERLFSYCMYSFYLNLLSTRMFHSDSGGVNTSGPHSRPRLIIMLVGNPHTYAYGKSTHLCLVSTCSWWCHSVGFLFVVAPAGWPGRVNGSPSKSKQPSLNFLPGIAPYRERVVLFPRLFISTAFAVIDLWMGNRLFWNKKSSKTKCFLSPTPAP